VVYHKNRVREYYNLLGNEPTPRRKDWIALPEKAKLVVKEDITIQRMFEGLKASAFPTTIHLIPDTNREYYYFQRLFRNVPNQRIFKKRLTKTLDSPSIAETSTRISIPAIEKETGQKVEFEFITTEFAGWKFVRLLSVKYDSARFECYVKRPDGRNVYPRDDPNIDLLKNSLIAFTESSVSVSALWLIHELYLGTENILINEEMALRLSLERFEPADEMILAWFKTLERDYTIFLE
jgi:hypothetical protein